MRNIAILGVVLALVGLVLGYFIFARQALTGQLIAVGDLFGRPRDLIGQVVNSLRDVETIRRNILLTGAGGFVLGAVLGGVLKGR